MLSLWGHRAGLQDAGRESVSCVLQGRDAMSWHPGGAVRCASATHAGHFVVEGYSRIFWDDWEAWSVTLSGSARQRRRRVRELRRLGWRVTPGGVAS